MYTITHLITGLGRGGAETMLYQLCKYKANKDIKYKIVTLGCSDYYSDELKSMGIDVELLDIRKYPIKTLRHIRSSINSTDILCCWMYHCNLIGYVLNHGIGHGLEVFRAKRKPIIWCVRHSKLIKCIEPERTMLINKICAKYSRNVDMILYNGERSYEAHVEDGYSNKNSYVIENGIDTDEYRKDKDARKNLLKELDFSVSSLQTSGNEGHGTGKANPQIVLSVTRNVPVKDVGTFIRAFGMVHVKHEKTIAVMCGGGITKDNTDIISLCKNNGLEIGKNIFLLGTRNDIPFLLSASDLYVLHSRGEAFPNTLIQAMSCSCVCVATDVGDVKKILGNNRFIVQPGRPDELCELISKCLQFGEDERKEIGEANRRIITDRYDIKNITEKYEQRFLSVV